MQLILKKVRNKISYLKARCSNPKYKFASLFFPLTNSVGKLKELGEKYNGNRCFIIGNGPSLNGLDLTLLKNEYTFGVNAIYINYEKMGFYSNFYAVEDFFVAEDRADEINNYKNSIKFFGNYLKYCITSDDQTIFLNYIWKSGYVNFPHFSTNALEKVYFGGTVSYLCMQLAYYMGFSEVYLIGFDHNYVIPNDVKITNNSRDILSLEDNDVNHFNKEYFGKGKRWHDPKVDRMENAYKKAKYYFEQDQRKIYNATAGGKLEVFERVDFNSLFTI